MSWFEDQVNRVLREDDDDTELSVEMNDFDLSDPSNVTFFREQFPDITYEGTGILQVIEMEDGTYGEYLYRKGIDNQEVYLGWDPAKRMFVQGHDCWDDHRTSPLFGDAHYFLPGTGVGRKKIKTKVRGGFYMQLYNWLHETIPGLVDLRLD